jgi:Xaa-Pro aminopeptidase
MIKPIFLLAILLLVASAPVAFAQEGFPLCTGEFPPEEFTQRRAGVYSAIGETGLAIIQGAPSPAGYTRFRQSNELYFLCGIESPHAYLLLDGGSRRASLYLPHRNEGRERGEGKLLSAEDADLVKKLAGVDAVFATDLLAEHLTRYARSTRVLYTPFSPAEGFAMSRDLALRAVADRAADPWERTIARGSVRSDGAKALPQIEVRDLLRQSTASV